MDGMGLRVWGQKALSEKITKNKEGEHENSELIYINQHS